MSVQGLQRAARLLNHIGGLLPVFAQADEAGVDVGPFVLGIMRRAGVSQEDIAVTEPIVTQLAAIIASSSSESPT